MAKFAVPEGTVSKVYAGTNDDGSMRTKDKPVAYRVDHTGPHVNWSGRKAIHGIKTPPVIWINGEGYYKVWNDEDQFWSMLGHCPKPKTDYEKARHDFLHGMLMQFGVINSLCFAGRWYYKRKKKKWLS